MVFNSVEFLLGFLPIFLLLYYLTPVRFRNITLLVGSVVFYTYGEPRYIFLLMGSVAVNFILGRYLYGRRWLFILAAAVNVLMLFFFKCMPLTEGFADKGGLPLGISFYTFQTISYLTDVYRGEIACERSIVRFGTYISMFPQLVAGPIVNYSEVSDDLKARTYRLSYVDAGLKIFVAGLVLKVLLADRLAILWHEIQTVGAVSISTPLAWMGAFGYSLQIYFDFYGYSLMAVGLGKMLGFSLPENFDLPYMSKSVREFYRKWHMTLGRWFKKYVYFPLGGSRKGTLRTCFNLFIVWALTSFWHGSSLNYFAWGMSLWLFIVLERLLDRRGFLEKSRVLSHCYVLFVIPLTWMCFAIPDFKELLTYFGRMFGVVQGVNVNGADAARAFYNYGVLFGVGILLCTPLPKKLFLKWKDSFAGMFILAVLFWMCVEQIMKMGDNPFMYFRF